MVMTHERLKFRENISHNKAVEKLYAYAACGEHDIQPRPRNKAELVSLLRSMGMELNEVAEICRDYRQPIPMFQNLLRPTWHVNASVRLVDEETGEGLTERDGPGVMVTSTYQGQMEAACRARDRAVKEGSLVEFHTAAVQGVASVESFISRRARIWNRKNPNEELLDSRTTKFSLDDKFDQWVPKMSEGHKLDKSDQRWGDFLRIRRLRDKDVVHAKEGAQAAAFAELGELINAFRLGVGGMLAQLHLHFGQAVPAVVINAVFMPDVEVVE